MYLLELEVGIYDVYDFVCDAHNDKQVLISIGYLDKNLYIHTETYEYIMYLSLI
jgi:hypothetical protein